MAIEDKKHNTNWLKKKNKKEKKKRERQTEIFGSHTSQSPDIKTETVLGVSNWKHLLQGIGYSDIGSKMGC